MRVLITGPLNEDDLQRLAQTLREIERQNLTEIYTMVYLPEAKEEEDLCSRETLREIFPALEGVSVREITIKRDEEPQR